MLRATATPRTPVLLAASAVASSHTGNTNETALATISIPAGAMGTNGGIEVRASASNTNNANNKTFRIRFGGTSGTIYATATATTSASFEFGRRIRNRNSASSQVGSNSSTATTPGTSTGALVTSSENTANAVDVVISVQLGVGTDTGTLEMYEVWLLPA